MNSPKIASVSFFSLLMIGVPVNPMTAALGMALRRFRCSVRVFDRCASSTRIRISSESFSNGNSSNRMLSLNVTSLVTTASFFPGFFSFRTIVMETVSNPTSLAGVSNPFTGLFAESPVG